MKTLEGNPGYLIFFDNVRMDPYIKSWNVQLSVNGGMGTASFDMMYLPGMATKDSRDSKGGLNSSSNYIDNMTNARVFVKNIFSNLYMLVFDGNIRGRVETRNANGSSLSYTATDYMNWLNRTVVPMAIPIDDRLYESDMLRWNAQGIDVTNVQTLMTTGGSLFKGMTLEQVIETLSKQALSTNELFSSASGAAHWDNPLGRIQLMGDIDASLRSSEVLDFVVNTNLMNVNTFYVLLNDILSKLMFEFYQDRDGIIRIKPPFWNQPVLKSHVIDSSLIFEVSERIDWTQAKTRVITTGGLDSIFQTADDTTQKIMTPIGVWVGGNPGIWAEDMTITETDITDDTDDTPEGTKKEYDTHSFSSFQDGIAAHVQRIAAYWRGNLISETGIKDPNFSKIAKGKNGGKKKNWSEVVSVWMDDNNPTAGQQTMKAGVLSIYNDMRAIKVTRETSSGTVHYGPQSPIKSLSDAKLGNESDWASGDVSRYQVIDYINKNTVNGSRFKKYLPIGSNYSVSDLVDDYFKHAQREHIFAGPLIAHAAYITTLFVTRKPWENCNFALLTDVTYTDESSDDTAPSDPGNTAPTETNSLKPPSSVKKMSRYIQLSGDAGTQAFALAVSRTHCGYIYGIGQKADGRDSSHLVTLAKINASIKAYPNEDIWSEANKKYAKKHWIGLPAWDCSSFVKWVYGKLGVSLSGNADTIRGSFEEVSFDKIQAGDIGCRYSSKAGRYSHVVIFGPNKEIIEAKGAQYGVIYTKGLSEDNIKKTRKLTWFGRLKKLDHISTATKTIDTGFPQDGGTGAYDGGETVTPTYDNSDVIKNVSKDVLGPSSDELKYGASILETTQPLIKFSVSATDAASNKTAMKALKSYTKFVYNMTNSLVDTASVSMIGAPWLRPGFNTWVDPLYTDKVYYIDSISHSGNPQSGAVTSLSLTHGRVRKDFTSGGSGVFGRLSSSNDNIFVNTISKGASKFGSVLDSSSDFESVRSDLASFHGGTSRVFKAPTKNSVSILYNNGYVAPVTPASGGGSGGGDSDGVSLNKPTGVRAITSHATLKQGSSGSRVRWLQTCLNAFGYPCGAVDGQFGSKTKAAVKKLQKARGLSQTGIADSSLKNVLYGLVAKKVFTSSQTYKVSPYTIFKKDHKKGEKSTSIKAIQKIIQKCYKVGVKITGEFDAQTVTALKKAQKIMGVSQSGTVDSETRRYILRTAIASKLSSSSKSNASASENTSVDLLDSALQDAMKSRSTILSNVGPDIGDDPRRDPEYDDETGDPDESSSTGFDDGAIDVPSDGTSVKVTFTGQYSISTIQSKLNSIYGSAPSVISKRASHVKSIAATCKSSVSKYYVGK